MALGVNVTTKVVVLNAATVGLGEVVTEKSEAFKPDIVIVPTDSSIFPVLRIVKVLVPATLLKSVQSEVEGVLSLFKIEIAFP